MNASKTNLVAVLTTTAVLLMASASFAKDKNNSGSPPPRPKKDNKVTSTTVSSTALGLAQGATLISDPGKKKPVPGGTVIGTNLNGITSLSGDKGSGFTITHGGNPPRSPESSKWKNKYWYCDHSHHIVFCDHFVEPAFANYVVVPGDTFEVISLKLFRTPGNSLFLASLNRLPVNVALAPGQVLVVPAF
jgi:hypothetical protein